MKIGEGIFKITQKDGSVIAESVRNSGHLYPLNMKHTPDIPLTDATTALVVTPSFDLLHKWLAHPGKDALQLMIRDKSVRGLPDIADDAKDFDCKSCIQAKMTHGPFQAGHEVAKE